jgi:hypothetical protein
MSRAVVCAETENRIKDLEHKNRHDESDLRDESDESVHESSRKMEQFCTSLRHCALGL